MVKSYRNAIVQARSQRFASDYLRQAPLDSIRLYTNDVDGMLEKVFREHCDKHINNVTLIALGGYGRRELCPWSDIDLLILHEGDHTHESIARLVRALWDMGFPLGCVVRSVSECKKILGEDLATDTALLDSRYLAGSCPLFRSLEATVINPYFIRRKQWFLQAIEAAISSSIRAAATSLYTVEPDLKNGICTLRDCHRIRWARRVDENMIIDFDSSLDFFILGNGEGIISEAFRTLLSIRCALHCAAGRRIDVLEFNFQPVIAEYLGLGKKNPKLLMERYFRTVWDVKTAIQLYFEQKRESRPLFTKVRSLLSSVSVAQGIRLLDGILWSTSVSLQEKSCNAKWLIELFVQAHTYQAAFSIDLLSKIRFLVKTLKREDFLQKQICDCFIAILSSRSPIEPIIRVMHETGVLEKLIPEFEAIRCKVEYDSYHEFTVDQHTLLALYTLDELKNDSEFLNIYDTITDLCTLRIAILLHDIGKSLDGNHSYNGAVMVSTICDRLEITEESKDEITWLVHNHLELSKFTFQREPELDVLQKFAHKIESVRMFNMLYLLTVVDIKSVGQKTWTGWKGVQLQAIYEKIKMLLSGKIPVDKEPDLLLSEQVQMDLKSIASEKDITVQLELFPEYERLTFCAIDRKRLFADIVGCLSSEGYNILNAQIMTTSDNKVVDIFTVEPDTTTRVSSKKRIVTIQKKLGKIIAGISDADKFISERLRLYPPASVRKSGLTSAKVTLDNSISKEFTIIELYTDDWVGLLYKIALVLTRFNVNIVSAKLSTRGTHIADVFYVNSFDGKMITNPQLQSEIKRSLLQLFE